MRELGSNQLSVPIHLFDQLVFILGSLYLILSYYQFPFVNEQLDVMLGNRSLQGMSIIFACFILILLSLRLKIKFDSKSSLIIILFFIGYLISSASGIFENGLSLYLSGDDSALYFQWNRIYKTLICFFVLLFSLRSKKRIDIFLHLFLWSCLFMLVTVRLGIYRQDIGSASFTINQFDQIMGYSRESFGILDKNWYAFLIVINILIAFYYLIIGNKKKLKLFLYYPVIILGTFNIFRSVSFGAMLTLSISFLTYIKFSGNRNFIHKYKTAIIISSIIFVMFVVIIPQYNDFAIEVVQIRIRSLLTSLGHIYSDGSFGKVAFSQSNTFAGRIGLAMIAFERALHSPIIGTSGITSSYSEMFQTGSHTEYVNILLHYGLITFLPFIILYYYILSNLIRIRKGIINHNLTSNIELLNLISLGISIGIAFLFNSFFSPLGIYFISFSPVLLAIMKQSSILKNVSISKSN